MTTEEQVVNSDPVAEIEEPLEQVVATTQLADEVIVATATETTTDAAVVENITEQVQ